MVVTNTGQRAAIFKVTYDKALPLRIRPSQGEIEAGASMTLLVDVDAKALGPFR